MPHSTLMQRRALLRAATATGAMVGLGSTGLGLSLAHAAAPWPAKPIHLIVPFPPGGGTDILSRLVANELSTATGWTVVPDNRGGAGGTIGLAEAARAKPTGYDIVMGQKDNMVVAPWIYPRVDYDPAKDFAAVARRPTPSPSARRATAPPFTWRASSSRRLPRCRSATCLTKAAIPP